MQIDWWTLGLQTVNALVLIWLLSRFLFRPIASILAEREATARRLLDDAAAAKAAALDLWTNKRAPPSTRWRPIARRRSTPPRRRRRTRETAARGRPGRRRSHASGHAEPRSSARNDRPVAPRAERASLLAVDIARRLLERLPAS